MEAVKRIHGLGKPYNFRSNTIALNLKNRPAYTVGTIFQDIAPSFFTAFFRAIRQVERKTLGLRGKRLIQGKVLKVSEGATLTGFAGGILSGPPTPALSVLTGANLQLNGNHTISDYI